MLTLDWPWMLLALPLPFVVRALLPPASGGHEAGLKVPSLAGFAVLTDRSRSEQLSNWRLWVAGVAWILLVIAAAKPERIGDELDVPVSGRNLMLAVDLSGSMDAKDFELGNRRVDRLTATKAGGERLHCTPWRRSHRPDPVRRARVSAGAADTGPGDRQHPADGSLHWTGW
ncbi:MAG: hypothetical protein U5K38_06240 [Woeseiaceae bacterium]|nr:hypothetical protein [Woeseiaceae bacterium]